MKKNVFRIMLVFVLTALVFALVACGESSSDTTTKKKKKTTTDDTSKQQEQNNDTDSGPKQATVAELKTALQSVVGGLDPYLEEIKSIEASSEVGIDIALGAYYISENSESEGNLKIGLQGNLKAQDPDLKLGVTINDQSKTKAGKEYLTLGFQSGKLYLTEPLSMINKNGGAPTSVKMDVSYLKDGVDKAAGYLMGEISALIDKYLSKINLQNIVNGLVDDTMLEMAKSFLALDESVETEIRLVISSANVNGILGLLKTMMKESWDDLTGAIDTVLNYGYDLLGLKINKSQELIIDKEEDGDPVTFKVITEQFLPALNIIGEFNNKDKETLQSVKLGINFESLKIEGGLSLDVNALGNGKSTTVKFENYSSKNLSGDINVKLGEKDREANLNLVLNTADGFKNLENALATATLTLGEAGKNPTATAKASYDGNSIQLDFSGYSANIANALPENISAKFNTNGANQFKYEFGDNSNIKIILKDVLENIGEPRETKPIPPKEALPLWQTTTIWAVAHNLIVDIKDGYFLKYSKKGSDGYLYIEDPTDTTTGYVRLFIDGQQVKPDYVKDETYEDFIVYLDSVIGKYVSFDMLDSSGNALELMDIINNISEKLDDAKALILDAVEADEGEAGVYLISQDGKGLFSFLAKFLNMPTVKADGTFDYENTTNEFDAELAIKYIEALFKLDDGKSIYSSWNQDLKQVFGVSDTEGFTTAIVNKIFGVNYDDFVNGGVYLFAKKFIDEGLHGAIGIKNQPGEGRNVKDYVEIGGSIKFVPTTGAGLVEMSLSDDEYEAAAAMITQNGASKDVNDQIWATVVDTLNYIFNGVAAAN